MSCEKEAVALLTFAPQQAKAWLYDLHEPNATGGIMLCRRHANATVVPMSWQLVDARDPAWPGPTDPNSHRGDELADAGMHGDARLLPSDVEARGRFDGLGGPVQPEPYAEPRDATRRAAGIVSDQRVGVTHAHAGEADMSLFELPLADVPAAAPRSELY